MSITGRILRSNVDMTQGKPLTVIFSFALPLLVGNLFNQLYNVVDTAIVGQALGVNALAALGAADWLNWLVLGLIQGFAQGFSIYMAQRFGAEDHEGLNRAIGATISLSAVISIFSRKISVNIRSSSHSAIFIYIIAL